MKPCTIGDRTWLIVAVVTVVFNWVCTGCLDLEIFGHFQTSQEKVFGRNFGTHCGGGTSRYIFGSRQHTGVDGAWEMRKAQVYSCRTSTGCVSHCSMYT